MQIKYTGVGTNNLKEIDVSLKRNSITLLSGPSGSGKSSLAINTIHAISEDELHQLMSLKDLPSSYKVKEYQGIIPSVCLQQENYNSNPRSTIGTYFNVDIHFRNLFATINGVSPRIFVFNRMNSACQACRGLGTCLEPDVLKIVDYSSRVKDNPFRPWRNVDSRYYKESLYRFCAENSIKLEAKFCDLKEKQQKLLLTGESQEKYHIRYLCNGKKRSRTGRYIGPLTEMDRALEKGTLPHGRTKYLTEGTCTRCNGARFRDEVLSYEFLGQSIGDLYLKEVGDLLDWMKWSRKKPGQTPASLKSTEAVIRFLQRLVKLKLDYLNLNRSIPSLSGGEMQRLRFAKASNSQFANFLYVLDEPTSGLHPGEVSIIQDLILDLRSKKNTILVIDHSIALRGVSDKVINLGPGGGAHGGRIVKPNIREAPGLKRECFEPSSSTRIVGASCNNILDLTIDAPLGTIVGVCGASGSGKTSLLEGILPKYLENSVYLNQSPIRGNAYSSVGTALGVLGGIQDLFAKSSGKEKSHFWYRSSGNGQCETCAGKGIVSEASAYYRSEIVCPDCRGMKFSREALRYKYRGSNIYEFLNLDIESLQKLVPEGYRPLHRAFGLAVSAGLGYLTPFQDTASLSGGEAQRVKFLGALLKRKRKQLVFMLDEPFRGVDDCNLLRVMRLLYTLVRDGNSVYVAEHNPLALSYCSHIVEFGLGAGRNGGKVIYNGPVDGIKNARDSLMAMYLMA